jgi:hypothetical protein
VGTVTISGQVFDIYGTQAAAKVYFSAALSGAAFLGAADLTQKKALVSSTRMIDRQSWAGQKTSPAQPLDFPRTGLVDEDGLPVSSATVPLAVEEASYELASALISDPTLETAPASGSNVRRLRTRDKVDVIEQEVETEYFRPTLLVFGRFPTVVQELLRPFLGGSASSIGPWISGGGVESAFLDPDEFALTDEGLP